MQSAMKKMTTAEWSAVAATMEERLETLRMTAERVFGSPQLAERWLSRPNAAVSGGDAPALACVSAAGFFEGMADLAKIELFEQREALKRARYGEQGRATGYVRLRV